MKNILKRTKKQVLTNQELNLYSVVEAVRSVIKPGEEALVPVVVQHILEKGNARFVH